MEDLPPLTGNKKVSSNKFEKLMSTNADDFFRKIIQSQFQTLQIMVLRLGLIVGNIDLTTQAGVSREIS